MPLNLPLMQNNITRDDLDAVINYLQQDDPILTQSKNVQAFCPIRIKTESGTISAILKMRGYQMSRGNYAIKPQKFKLFLS